MKKILILLFVTMLISNEVCTQVVERGDIRFIGSFVFQNETFNYEYKFTPNQISSLKFDLVTKASQLDPKAINEKIAKMKIVLAEKYKSWNIDEAGLTSIENSLNGISSNIASSIENANNTNNLIDDLTHILSEGIKSDSLQADRILEINNLISELNSFKLLTNSILKTGNEIRFSELSPQIVKTILSSQVLIYFENRISNDKEVDDLSQKIFYEIMARRGFDNDQPSTAYLRLISEAISGYAGFNDKSKTPIKIPMKFIDAQVEFEAGTLKNIEVKLAMNIEGEEHIFKFRNNMPISVTHKFTPEKWTEQRVFASEPKKFPWEAIEKSSFQAAKVTNPAKLNKQVYFNLGELLRYDIILSNYREDYSPEDIVVSLSMQQNVVELKKKLRSKILSVKTFTDFNGVNSEQPNGLIQLEGNLGVNLFTQRSQRLFGIHTNKMYHGFVTKVELIGHLSKIEENNKYLNLTSKDGVDLSSNNGSKQFKIEPLRLLNFRSNGIDLNTNLYKLNMTSIMSNFQINGRFGIFRTAVSDSLTVNDNNWVSTNNRFDHSVSSAHYTLEFILQFMPEDRYGFMVSGSQMWVKSLSHLIMFDDQLGNKINVISLEGHLNLNRESTTKLFFRWRFNYLASESKVNFNQVQLGYLVDVFKTNSR